MALERVPVIGTGGWRAGAGPRIILTVTPPDTSAPTDAGPLQAAIAALGRLRVHDVSPLLENGMPGWSTHPPLEIRTDARSHAEHGYAAQTLVISEHTGSHVDAPFHLHPGTATIDEIAPDALIRPFKKFDLGGADDAAGEPVGLEALLDAQRRAGFELEAGDVAVLDFGWDRYYAGHDHQDNWWGHNEPGLDEEACRHLAEAGVAAVASDTAGCDVAKRDGKILGGPGHESWFLPRGILIVEGLRHLDQVPPVGLFLALPLKIKGGSGSPVRVLLLTE